MLCGYVYQVVSKSKRYPRLLSLLVLICIAQIKHYYS